MVKEMPLILTEKVQIFKQSSLAQVKLRPLVLMQKGQVAMRSQGKKGMAENYWGKQPRRQILLM